MSKTVFFIGFKHYLRLMSRGIFGLFIFTVLPVAIAGILSFIYSQNTTGEIYVNGYNMVATQITIGMMLFFQLNGGIYMLDCLNNDHVKPMRWRLKAIPCPTYVFVFSAAAACTVFTMLQGLLIVIFTAVFMKVYWGSILVTIFSVFFISIISQFMNMILFLLVRNVGTVESLSWFLSSIMASLGGMMIPLPDSAFFRFMKQFGTPFSLAQSAIKESGFLGTSSIGVWVYLFALLVIASILSAIVTVLGRRQLS